MKKMKKLVYQPREESNVKFVQKKMPNFIVLYARFIIVKNVKLNPGHFLKKKHEKFISQDIFIENQASKEKTNNNTKCPKHNQKFKFYCEEEDQLICPDCTDNCLDQKHLILSLNTKCNEIYQKMERILKEIQTKEKVNQETLQKSQQNKIKLKQKIQQISQQIERESDLLKQQIEKSKNKHLIVLKTIEIIIENQFNKIIQKNEKNQKKINQNKTKMQKISKLKPKCKK
ncbi:tripartite motif-containing protein [Anaeramoeba flamelloides]|uniref:Tripartite motif-containing protein n=1 Tax=Anaeramoeba flamelloides TaxID=1746091 RepID=A0ABQ8XWH2_9EUKA|nr:tripartite motif-containing protein [Anaeramoeba flamelloides]